ncbi:MAG: OpgC domain-containing protein [Rhodomicrobium sp.]
MLWRCMPFPSYLDILPLYILLFAAFPLVYFGLRKHYWLTLAVSAAIWLVVNLDPAINLPNWIGGGPWYFDPFAWQFLFTIGAVLAMVSSTHGGGLPRVSWLIWASAIYLVFAFFQSVPWSDWGLPNLQLFDMTPPDKSTLNIPRLLDMLALAYLVLSSGKLREFALYRFWRPIEACGRHSLEVFSAGCVFALLGRLVFRTYGAGLGTQIAVNMLGLCGMCLLGLYLERRRQAQPRRAPASKELVGEGPSHS